MMAFEPLFYLALATIALGNGLFLPSLPSQINDLYRADDPRRGRAYNVTTSASTSAASSRRWSAEPWASSTAGTTASAPPASAWSSACSIYVLGGALPAARARRAQSRQPSLASRRDARTSAACGWLLLGMASPPRSSAAPTSRSATPLRCGPTSASIARCGGVLHSDDLVPVAESAAGHQR